MFDFHQRVLNWKDSKRKELDGFRFLSSGNLASITKDAYLDWKKAIGKEKITGFKIRVYLGIDEQQMYLCLMDDELAFDDLTSASQALEVPLLNVSLPQDYLELDPTIPFSVARERYRAYQLDGNAWYQRNYGEDMVCYFKISDNDFHEIFEDQATDPLFQHRASFPVSNTSFNNISLFFGLKESDDTIDLLGSGHNNGELELIFDEQHTFVDVTSPSPPF